MSNKALIFVLSLVIVIASDTVEARSLKVQKGKRVSKGSGEPLIKKACVGSGTDEKTCMGILEDCDKKTDADDLALFAIKFVADQAGYVASKMKKISNDQNLDPMMDDSLEDCMEQYDSLDDVIEVAQSSLMDKTYDEAIKFTQDAIESLAKCDSGFSDTNKEEKVESNSKKETKWSQELRDSNSLLKNMLRAASSILKDK